MPKVSSITRVLEIIEAVSYASKPLSPLELSQQLDIPEANHSPTDPKLGREGFVTVDIGGGIIPGKRVRNLSVELWLQRQFFNERQVVLHKLVEELKETCHMCYSLSYGHALHQPCTDTFTTTDLSSSRCEIPYVVHCYW